MNILTTSLAAAAALALTYTGVSAASLTIANVTQAQINCIYDRACRGLGTNSSDNLQFYQQGNGAQIRTRTLTGVAGSPAAGKTGYQYRIDLTAANLNSECIRGMAVGFGTIDQLNYKGSGPTHVFVITSGGPGTVAPSSVDFNASTGLILIEFGQPVCPGKSSFEIGLSSSSARATRAPVWLWEASAPPIMLTTARVP